MLSWPLPGGPARWPIGSGGTSEDHLARGVGNAIDIPGPFDMLQYPSVTGAVSSVGWMGDQCGNGVDYEGWQDGSYWKVRHCHLDSVYVQVGDVVIAGETPLGTIGLTGNTSGPHIHQVIERDGVRVRPEDVHVFGAVPDPGGGDSDTEPFPDVAPAPGWHSWAPGITEFDVENALNVVWGLAGELDNAKSLRKKRKAQAAAELRDAAIVLKQVAHG